MRNIKLFFYLISIFFILTFLSCVEQPQSDINKYDYGNDGKNFYQEYNELAQTDSDTTNQKQWNIEYSFYGKINGNSRDFSAMENGDGNLIIHNTDGSSTTINNTIFAIRKSVSTSAGESVPIIQIFFGNSIKDGQQPFYVLQIEGSAVAKNETYYVNRSSLYQTTATIVSNQIKKICFEKFASPTINGGKIFMLSHSIRIGDILNITGYADLENMEPTECKNM